MIMEKERQIPSDAQLLARWVTTLANKPDERVASTGQRTEKLIMIGSMSYEKIEQNTDALLRVIGADKEGVGLPVRLLLHHLLTARAMFDEMDEQERKNVRKFNKKLRNVFDSNFVLKEGKRKKEKETSSPAPLLLEKEIKEKDEKMCVYVGDAFSDGTGDFEARREAFRQECLKLVGKYDVQLVTNFYYYWSEKTKKKNRMRKELETTWETENRMVLWVNNQYATDTTAAAIRLKRTKGKEAKQAKEAEQQQVAAQLRQQQDEAERRKDEETKARRMDSRDYVKINPNGFLAKLQREEENKKSNPKNHK